MELMYTQEEEKFRLELREFLKRELEPFAQEIEREEKFPREFLSKLGAKGYMGVMYPQELGGMNKGIIYDHIVSEEIASISPVTDTSRSVTAVMCAAPIYRFGTGEQKQKYLAPLVKGEAVGAIAISEPVAGSVKQKQPKILPLFKGTKNSCFCGSSPKRKRDSLGRMLTAIIAPQVIEARLICSTTKA